MIYIYIYIYYHPENTKRIVLGKTTKSKLVNVAYHEYTHHLQNDAGWDFDNRIIIEGHARGVQKYLSKIRSEKEDNPVIIHELSCSSLDELSRVYEWICRSNNQSPSPSIIISPEFGFYTDNHAFGNSLFSILEKKRGPEIYSSYMKELHNQKSKQYDE
jgi:hypothetical protein